MPKLLQNGGADGCLLQSVDGIIGAEDDIRLRPGGDFGDDRGPRAGLRPGAGFKIAYS